jgi:mannose-6-phosphate isomerase
MKMYPLKFKPIYKSRIWGGRKIETFLSKKLPAGKKIGESWEISDLPEDKSIIANGELAGLTLEQAIQKYPQEITGDKNFKLPFPLLIKFIDAEDILSIQVHPDEQTCKKMGKGEPKTECWYVLYAEKDAFIYKGLKKGVTKKQFQEAVGSGTVEQLLQKVFVKPGQCHYLPAGTVHTLSPGLIIAEIQTPSDTTYRIFDFNRLDKNGKPRPLHIEDALESIHFDNPEKLPVTTAGVLADGKYFKIVKGKWKAGCEKIEMGQMKVIILLSGNGKITTNEDKTEAFTAGDVLLIPAYYDGTAICEQDTEHLIVTLSQS